MAPVQLLALEKSALTQELGKIVLEAQDQALALKSHFDIGISGGSQGPTLAEALLGNDAVKWSKWRVWLVDERIVPLDHEDSNWRLFEQHILSKLPVDNRPQGFTLSTELLTRIDSLTYKDFAADYEKRLIATLGVKPALDLALLGMGPDGHTCSLFPGSPLLEEKELFVSGLDDSPKPPPSRITLTKPALALAGRIVFFAAGAAKKEAIHKIFTVEDTSVPSKQVIDVAKDRVTFLTDPAAVGDK